MAKELKNRKDMDPRWQWRLEDIFATEEAYEQAYEQAQADIGKMAGTRKREPAPGDPGRGQAGIAV